MATSDTAPASIVDGRRDDLLRISVTNPGATGGPDLEIASLGLRIDVTPGVALTGAQSSNLLNAIEVHADTNGTGIFEPAADSLIGTLLGPLPAANGTLSFPLANSAPTEVRVIAGQSRAYFVVVRLTGNASSHTPHTLRITHVTNGPGSSTARESGSGIPLTLQPVADVSSSTVTALFNNAPTTSGIANRIVSDPAIPTRIPLFPAFQDAEDAAADLRYEISANSNTGLFAFTGIDPSTGILSLDYKADVSGNSSVSIRATDRAGKSVTVTFQVGLTLLRTYVNWAAFHFGPGNPTGNAEGDDPSGTGVSNFAKYAFGLNPLTAGDRAGLPRTDKLGCSRVFTHLKPKYATDITYTYEISPDLTTWTTALSGVDYFERNKDLSDGRLRADLLLLGKSPSVFLRARASQNGAASQAPGGPGSQFTAQSTPNSYWEDPAPPAPGAGSSRSSAAGLMTPGTASFPQETVLTTAASFANAVIAADLDGDGLPDVLSASLLDNKVAWYRNTGNGTFGAQTVITTANGEPSAVAAADLDGDGRLDVITGSHDNKLAWHRNLGNGTFGPQQIVSTNYAYISSVSAPDLDNDGKRDLLCTGLFDNRVGWHHNSGDGTFGPQQIIGVLSGANAASGPYQATAADLDGDGFLDVVTASVTDDKIAWYRNNGNGTFGQQRVIATGADGASTVATADFDGDGWIDVICGSAVDNKVSFFRNNGNSTFGPRVALTSDAVGAFSVIAADLNGDGAPDVVSASLTDDKIAWYANLGGGTFGPQQIISTAANDAVSVAAADFDGNGTIDVVSASQVDSKIAAYLNQGVSGGGPAAIATINTAPPGIIEGTSSSVLRVTVSNRLASGGNHVQLAKLAFLFESSPGVPLTATQAASIIDRVLIYADTNGSLVFEPGADSLLQTTSFLALASGRFEIPLQSASPELPVPPQAARDFFVVVSMKPDAAAQTPHSFRITHLTEGSPKSVVKDSQSGSPVFAGLVANVASSLVTAQANQNPTTTGIPAVTVFDTVAPTIIPLTQYFADAEDDATGLRYSIAGNTSPSLFDFVGVDPVTGALTLRYHPGVGGQAQLTVRATDTRGKWVATTFAVNVVLITSFADWQNSHGAGNTDFRSYAFALNPAMPGDTSRLPLMYSVGQTRILSHYKPRYAADLAYRYDVSPDLINWSVAKNGIHYYEFTTDLANGLQKIELVLLVDWPKAFFRPRANVLGEVTGPTGGTMTLTPASPVDASAELTVAFAGWTSAGLALSYTVLIDDVVVSPAGSTASRTLTGPATPGPHTLKGRVTDSLGNFAEVTQAFTVNTALESWRFAYFGTTANAGNAADLADPDGDGYNNISEYIAGLSPTSALSRFDVRVEKVAGQPTQKAITCGPIVAGRAYVVKCKSSLSDPQWIPLGNFSASESGTVRTVIDLDAGTPQKIYIVEIAKP